MLIPLSVRTVQQGLTMISREIPAVVPSPGPIDGVWGRNTRNSLARFISSNAGSSSERLAAEIAAIDSTPARANVVMVDDINARTLVESAGDYLRIPEGRVHPLEVASDSDDMPAITIGPHLDPEPLASPATDSGLSTGAKIALGVLALGAIGGIVYAATRKKGRRK